MTSLCSFLTKPRMDIFKVLSSAIPFLQLCPSVCVFHVLFASVLGVVLSHFHPALRWAKSPSQNNLSLEKYELTLKAFTYPGRAHCAKKIKLIFVPTALGELSVEISGVSLPTTRGFGAVV